MADASLDFGGDLSLTPDGDLALVDGIDLDNQFIVRDLLTAVRGYVFHSAYGAGLPQRIGRTALDRGIKAVVRSRLALLPVVARVPIPIIDVDFKADRDGICSISITYTNAVTGVADEVALEFPTTA